MDVNVRDLEEIVRFGRSLQSFLSDYLGVLNQVGQGSQQDYTQARNNYNTIRTYTEAAERDLRVAERQLESAINRAYRHPEKDLSDRIEYLERMMVEKQRRYERNKLALEEAESLIRNVKVNTDMVLEQVNRSRKQIQDSGQTALSSIEKAAQAIMQYNK